MKKYLLAAIASATLLYGGAAYAQGISLGVGPGGAGVRVDDGYRGDRGDWHDRGYRHDRGYWDDRRYGRRDRDYRRGRGDVIVIDRDRPRQYERY